jgi:hypothetical protein
MSGIRAEPRIAVMEVVELSWEDQTGTSHHAPARIEDRSSSGACIRVKAFIGVGSGVQIQSYREKFSGVATYCRGEAGEHVIGVRRDAATTSHTTTSTAKTDRPTNAPVSAPIRHNPAHSIHFMSAPGIKGATTPEQPKLFPVPESRPIDSKRPALPSTLRRAELHPQPPQVRGYKENTQMPKKWTDLSPWRQKQDSSPQDASNGGANGTPTRGSQVPDGIARPDKPTLNSGAPASANGHSNSQGDLLSMDDIYRAASIMTPRMGYSIRKVADMLASDHMRGLSDDMKRASVLMALDAAGIPVDEVLRDAASRHAAINNYESEQWEHFEAYWAAKAEENARIQTDLERITAQHLERIKRNLDEVAQEKVTFAGWQAMKQQEAQLITEAAEICSDHSTAEPAAVPSAAHRSLVPAAKLG